MKAIKKYENGGEVNISDTETRREKHRGKVDERNVRRWQRRYKRFRRKGNPAGREAELYATKPWLEKDRPSLIDIIDKLTLRDLRKGPRVKGGVDEKCKAPPAWAN